ncbi:arf-GAP with coiled-coil, ANK repeat and PH domain-containing protein 1-like [Acridotheres tristis]
MTVKLDFEECLRDSPWFRAAVEEAESDAAELETHLEKVLKLCSAVLEAGPGSGRFQPRFGRRAPGTRGDPPGGTPWCRRLWRSSVTPWSR